MGKIANTNLTAVIPFIFPLIKLYHISAKHAKNRKFVKHLLNIKTKSTIEKSCFFFCPREAPAMPGAMGSHI